MAMTELTIHPTHTCFTDALEYLEALAIEAMRRRGTVPAGDAIESAAAILLGAGPLRVVHAICAPEGERFSHAWLERGGEVVIFSGLLDGKRVYFETERAEFYRRWAVLETTKYTPREVWELNRRHGTYGPWERKYLELCRGRRLAAPVAGHGVM